MSKGSKRRPADVDSKKFEQNWNRIFPNSCKTKENITTRRKVLTDSKNPVKLSTPNQYL